MPITSGNVRTLIFAAYNVSALANGSAITVNHTSVTSRAVLVSVFRGLASSNVLDRTQTGTGAGSTAPSSGTTSTTTQADELLIGGIGLEGPNYDAPSVWVNSFSGSWRMGTRFGSSTGGGDTDITAQMGWKIVGATGTYTAQLTSLNTSRDWAAAIATLKAGSDIPPVQYTITASASANGTIAPLGSVTVTQGSSQTFNMLPNAGYQVDDVLVDGSSVGAVTSYTFNNVQAGHTIAVSFEAIPPSTIAFVGNIGSVSNNAAGTTLNIPVGASGVATGNTHRCWLCFSRGIYL